jgi:hypothetical protein
LLCRFSSARRLEVNLGAAWNESSVMFFMVD